MVLSCHLPSPLGWQCSVHSFRCHGTILSPALAVAQVRHQHVDRTPYLSSLAQKIGRPVRIVSLSFNGKSLAEIAEVVDREGAKGVDLIILPETWRGQEDSPESLDGPTVTAMAALAKKHSTYLVCPIDRRDGTHRLNTAVLIDRAGKISGVYDKVYPYWSEFDLKQPVEPGQRGEGVSN